MTQTERRCSCENTLPPLYTPDVTWLSCSLRRSSVTPRDLIPRTRHAACTSFTLRLPTPSSAMSCKNTRGKIKHQPGRRPTFLFVALRYLVVCSDGSQLHDELEAQEVVGADGLELQEATESHQLRPGQVVQSQLVLKQFGELQDLLVAGSLAGVTDLRRSGSRGGFNAKRTADACFSTTVSFK